MKLGNKLTPDQLRYLHGMMSGHVKYLGEQKEHFDKAREYDKSQGIIDPSKEKTDSAFDGLNQEIQLANGITLWAEGQLRKAGYKLVKKK